jgi:hypothetical protein
MRTSGCRTGAKSFSSCSVKLKPSALRKNAAVLGDETLHLFLEPGLERIPRSAHVGEFGIAAFGRDDVCAQRRISRGNGFVAAVAVPELVADDGEQPLAVVARQDLVARGEIGDVGQGWVIEPHPFLRLDLPVGRFKLAQAFRERELLFGGKRSAAAKYQHRVAIHRLLDLVRGARRDRLTDVDA